MRTPRNGLSTDYEQDLFSGNWVLMILIKEIALLMIGALMRYLSLQAKASEICFYLFVCLFVSLHLLGCELCWSFVEIHGFVNKKNSLSKFNLILTFISRVLQIKYLP